MESPTRYPGQPDPDFSQLPEAPGWVDLLHALNWSPVMDLFFSCMAPIAGGGLYACGHFAETVASPIEYFITRLHDDGRLDTGFGEQGVVRGSFPVNFKAIMPTRLILQDDGKLLMQALACSDLNNPPDPLSFVLRLQENGEPDPSFADNGLMRLELPVGRYNVLAAGLGDLQVLPDRRILGSHSGINYLNSPNPKASGVLYRLTANGQLDNSFNASGLLDLSVAGASLHINRFVTRPDNALIVVGQISRPGDPWHNGLLARLDAQGQLDRSFGSLGDGFQELPLFGQHLHLETIAQRPDGSLIVAGRTQDVLDDPDASHGQGIIIGLTANGLLDPGFNRGQPLITPINPSYEVQWLDIQALEDGRILLAGRSRNRVSSFNTYLYLARYLADGRPDPEFGNQGNGRVDSHTGGNNDAPLQMARQGDNKILIGLNASAFRKGTLLRYLS